MHRGIFDGEVEIKERKSCIIIENPFVSRDSKRYTVNRRKLTKIVYQSLSFDINEEIIILHLQEMLVTGVVMTCGMLAIPAWVMAHIKEYKGQE